MKIIFAGEGGQGIQVIAEILTRAAFTENKAAVYIPNFGVEQRGGVSVAFVTIQDLPIVYPKFIKADFAVILSERARERIKNHIGERTKIVLGPAVINGIKTDMPSKAWNIVALGRLNKMAKAVRAESLAKAVEERFAKQFAEKPKLKELDMKALGVEGDIKI